MASPPPLPGRKKITDPILFSPPSSHFEQEGIQNVNPLISNAANFCIKERNKKIDKFAEELRPIITEVETDLNDIEKKLQSYKMAVNKKTSSKESEMLFTSLEEAIDNFEKKYVPLINTQFTQKFFDYELTELNIQHYKDVLINSYVNKFIYKKEVERWIENNREFLITNFFKDKEENPEFKVTFIENSETHNEGKVAIYITFKDNPICVCKPRDASIDEAIIQLFKEINAIPLDKRTVKNTLPTYSIHNIENISIWEFVEGKLSMDKHNQKVATSAKQFINTSVASGKQALLKNKLNEMHAILSRIHVGDLHGANIKFRGLSTNDPEIVPIDLENIQ
ncbi:MAG: hypothetical protein K940chlam8_00521, partial [Chlamydiae bacterium]|nr:hypothetical protein [Chlamydiota bacterium]